MRYTTIIDLTEWPTLYRTPAVRLLYLHLCLKAGYHDHDRDIVQLSLYQLSRDTGLTVSAIRCALSRLEAYALIQRPSPGIITVVKYVPSQTITSRARTQKQADLAHQRAIAEQEKEERERRAAIEQAKRDQYRAAGKSTFMVWYEDQVRLAAAGDIEAKRTVERHRQTYELHKNQISKEQHHP